MRHVPRSSGRSTCSNAQPGRSLVEGLWRFLMKTNTAAARPQIHMLEEEAERLADLALGVESRSPQVSELLLRETSRAKLHGAGSFPSDVVAMGSLVEFLDEGTGARRKVQLVYPLEADIAAGRISILTPVGAGLLGLREGQSILWPDREGHERRLVIVSVEQQARDAA